MRTKGAEQSRRDWEGMVDINRIMALRQDPRIIVFMICAIALAYWLIVPRGRTKTENKGVLTINEKTNANLRKKDKGGHGVHEGLGLGHLDHMHEGAVVEGKETELRRQKEEVSRLSSDLKMAYKQMEQMKEDLISKENLLKEQQNKQKEETGLNNKEAGIKEEAAKVERQPFGGHRLFHLDLKGAAPKFEYLKKLLPYLQGLGVSGILIEYEDMFPFEGELSVLKCKNAYTKKQIQEILGIAKELNLIVIPLIQTFGHLEFALKHKKFANLRETERITNSICPLKNESRIFIKEVIREILDLHSEAKWIHLGGDEVWNLKTCSKCKESSMNSAELYQHHMIPLLKFVKELKSGEVTPIIWDDMMRDWDVENLKLMAKYVEPMVWAYVPDLDNYYKFPNGMWKRYFASFPKIWIASSFKGADKPVTNYPPIDHHIQNHLSWLKILSAFPKSVQVIGVALTGWSRFDHYASLCELLPASIPSIAFCLTVLRKGYFDGELQAMVSHQLGFKALLPISVSNFKILKVQHGDFPGSDVFEVVSKFEKAKGWFDSGKVREIGWAGNHNLQNNHISIYQLETVVKSADVCLEQLGQLENEAKKVLSKYFCESTVNEWLNDKIMRLENEAKQMKGNVLKILRHNVAEDKS